MSRTIVGLCVMTLAGSVSIACTDAPAPLTSPRDMVTSVQSASSIPYATGVHTAAIPALDPVFSTGGLPTGINDGDEIIGDQVLHGPGLDSVIGVAWTAHFGLRRFPLGVGQSTGTVGVNNLGQVVMILPGIPPQPIGITPHSAAIWNWFGNVRQLPLLSNYAFTSGSIPIFPSCIPAGINNSSVVAGVCTIPSASFGGSINGPYATIWTKSGTPWPITGTLAPANVTAISDAGYVAGGQVVGGGPGNAVVFTPAGRELILPNPTGKSTSSAEAMAVNNTGQAAGFRIRADPACGTQASQPVVWLTADSALDIGACGSSIPLGSSFAPQTTAVGITDDGIVVGNSVDSASTNNDQRFAFVWTPATGLQRLPGLEGGVAKTQEILVAVAINHRHQVVGWVRNDVQGYFHTLVWTLP
jgi:hypothetical protein